MIAKRHGIGDDVAIDAGEPADHGALAHPAELLHRRQPAEDHAVADLDMAAQRHRIGKGDVVADMAIMADMGIGHEIAARAHRW